MIIVHLEKGVNADCGHDVSDATRLEALFTLRAGHTMDALSLQSFDLPLNPFIQKKKLNATQRYGFGPAHRLCLIFLLHMQRRCV